jgi:hypothetical protein
MCNDQDAVKLKMIMSSIAELLGILLCNFISSKSAKTKN